MPGSTIANRLGMCGRSDDGERMCRRAGACREALLALDRVAVHRNGRVTLEGVLGVEYELDKFIVAHRRVSGRHLAGRARLDRVRQRHRQTCHAGPPMHVDRDGATREPRVSIVVSSSPSCGWHCALCAGSGGCIGRPCVADHGPGVSDNTLALLVPQLNFPVCTLIVVSRWLCLQGVCRGTPVRGGGMTIGGNPLGEQSGAGVPSTVIRGGRPAWELVYLPGISVVSSGPRDISKDLL